MSKYLVFHTLPNKNTEIMKAIENNKNKVDYLTETIVKMLDIQYGSHDVQNENGTNVIFLFFTSDSNKAARYKRYGLCVCNRRETKILRMFYSLLEHNISFENFVEVFYEVVKKFNLKTDNFKEIFIMLNDICRDKLQKEKLKKQVM